ncbi:hypothetical protein Q5H93_16110 [Hymenobacter sp. ASUV-10]|uniref:Uncharacterized protein n=1 Tax=Hymenobacter aranciens TaxID=3063996 RepID=A0ABT9BDC5_9BACT|nr:hypothetical protein [Hymenobacter sp. ASUV-10]MDO7876270.1 hypothetical protein [Hymenobacter sp. ASUV-10]
MASLPPDLAAAFAQRVAERDNPPPAAVSQEPAAIQARLEQWLLMVHQVRNVRARRRQTQALLALMQHPELETLALGRASGPPALADRSAARLAVQLQSLGFTAWEYRGLYRYHRLTRATEDALLLVVAGGK